MERLAAGWETEPAVLRSSLRPRGAAVPEVGSRQVGRSSGAGEVHRNCDPRRGLFSRLRIPLRRLGPGLAAVASAWLLPVSHQMGLRRPIPRKVVADHRDTLGVNMVRDTRCVAAVGRHFSQYLHHPLLPSASGIAMFLSSYCNGTW